MSTPTYDSTKNFWISFFIGIVLAAVIIIALGKSPAQQLKKDQQEAVDRGYAHWAATTNGEVQFEWNRKE